MEIEKLIADDIDEVHKKLVVAAMVNHAAQSAIRAARMRLGKAIVSISGINDDV